MTGANDSASIAPPCKLALPVLIFVVGMPRSGTKLLRDLLNMHTELAIFPNESHFIPYFNRLYGTRTDLNDIRTFNKFFRHFCNTTFCRRLELRGIVIAETDWRSFLTGGQYSDVLRALFMCYRVMAGAKIVGDKTPEYITQIPILSNLLPESRFIHIIRDPRDYALSIRKAWRKNMPRAVQRWKRHIRKYRSDVASISESQITVRYEDLVTAPEQVLARICIFLGVDFQPRMTSLEFPSEELGDARGLRTVLGDNTQKWISRMSHGELQEIESIAGVLMSEFGYAPATIGADNDLSRLRELYYRTIDAANLFRFRLRAEGGVLPAFREAWRAHKHSGVDE